MDTQETLTTEDVAALFNAPDNDDHPEGFTQVLEGEWTQEHKDQFREDVYRHDATGRFFEVTTSRRGAYWSDWDYCDATVVEVYPVTKTVTAYVQKKVAA